MITPETTGFTRKAKRLWWSALRRLQPRRVREIPFDGDLRIAVRPMDRLGRRVHLDGYSDRELAAFLDRCIQPGMTFFDVGSHFGQFTLMAAKRAGAAGRAYAFEATRETYQQLTTNVALNGFKNVTATHAAIFDKPGELEMNVCVTGAGEFNSLTTPSGKVGETVREKVKAITLDDFIREQKIGRVDVMKLDVEGAELGVLRGARAFLGAPDAPPVFCEFNEICCAGMGYDCSTLRAEFESLGYRLYRFNELDGTLTPEPPPPGGRYPETVNLVAAKRIPDGCTAAP